MMDDFNESLAIVKSELRQKNKLESMLRSAQASFAMARRKRDKLKKLLAKEQSDVDAMEGLSITGLFRAMLGDKEQRLQKERQELVAAKLKHDQAADTAKDLSDDVKRLKEALVKLENANAEYELLLNEKADHLAANKSDATGKLVELTHQIADLTVDQKELDDAAKAGHLALKAVEEIQGALASAANWGVFDMMGGGMLATMAKHSRIDAAKKQARIAQRKLIQFEEELADTSELLRVSLKIDGFSTFADYFFDGLIADWIVQSKIQRAKAECSKAISSVRTAIRQCENRRKSVRSEIEMLTERKQELIERA